jgi:hypothetical protein
MVSQFASSRSYALGILPFAWGFLAACSANTSPAGETAEDAGPSQTVSPGGGAADSGVGGDANSGTAHVEAGLVSTDSGVVVNTPPPGCPSPDAGTPSGTPVGTLLVSGNALSARGVTSDGYEIYSDDAAMQLYAVPVAGGTPQSIVALGSKFWVTVVGKVVFAWSNVTSANVGALTVWSSAKGAHAVSSASFGILGASSSDGTQVLYVGNVDPTGATGDVYVAGADGSAATSILQAQQLAGCFPQLGFAGTYAVASHCDTARGTGPSATISSFLSPAWTRADLVTDAENTWSADAAATMVLASTNAGLLVLPIGGGAGTVIDSQGFLGQLIAGGTTAIYSTTSGALRSSPTMAPSPMALSPAFGGFYSVSPDQSTVLFYENSVATGTDIYLSATVMPNTARAVSTATNGTVSGDAFTSDSLYALYSTNNDMCTGAAAFNALQLSAGSPTVLGHDVWSDWSASGSKVIFNDNYIATGGLRFGRADIESVNLAAGGTPVRIVAQADAVIDLTPAKDQIIYSWSVQPGPLAGLYETPVP